MRLYLVIARHRDALISPLTTGMHGQALTQPCGGCLISWLQSCQSYDHRYHMVTFVLKQPLLTSEHSVLDKAVPCTVTHGQYLHYQVLLLCYVTCVLHNLCTVADSTGLLTTMSNYSLMDDGSLYWQSWREKSTILYWMKAVQGLRVSVQVICLKQRTIYASSTEDCWLILKGQCSGVNWSTPAVSVNACTRLYSHFRVSSSIRTLHTAVTNVLFLPLAFTWPSSTCSSH